ncbi:hypothetical protein AAC387_Pa01g1403 [Persea americana]
MGRRPCCAKEGLRRGAWSTSEDRILSNYITTHGEGKWRDLPRRAGLERCGKSCRLRWLNYLRPGIKRGNITHVEEDLIIRLHRLLGNRWSLIAGRLPGRTDNEIKNYWNTYLSNRVKKHPKKSQVKNPTKEPCVDVPKGTLESHQVIRTKAGRCTKVFFQPQQGGETKIEILVGGREGAPNIFTKIETFPFHDQNYSDANMDFDMEEFLSSNVLDLNFLEDCYEEIRGNGSTAIDGDNQDNNVLDFSNHPFSFGEETLENHWMTDLQAFESMKLNVSTLPPRSQL